MPVLIVGFAFAQVVRVRPTVTRKYERLLRHGRIKTRMKHSDWLTIARWSDNWRIRDHRIRDCRIWDCRIWDCRIWNDSRIIWSKSIILRYWLFRVNILIVRIMWNW